MAKTISASATAVFLGIEDVGQRQVDLLLDRHAHRIRTVVDLTDNLLTGNL